MNSTFVSLDIETTGLDEETCQVIEIGAVIDDWLNPLDSPPEFHAYVVHDTYQGEPYAMSLHSEIFRRIAIREEGFKYLTPSQAVFELHFFLSHEGGYKTASHLKRTKSKARFAGKNLGAFDMRFLRKLPKFKQTLRYHHRFLDPGMLFWNPLTDPVPPDTAECMKRAGIEGEVAHTALEDEKVVAKLIQIAAKQHFDSPCDLQTDRQSLR